MNGIRYTLTKQTRLKEVEGECKELDISFHLFLGQAKDRVPEFVQKFNIGGVVTDFCPLRVPSQWVEDVKKSLPPSVPFCQVDAHNIVPCWFASDKQEYGARTIRKKIHDKIGEFLTEFPPLVKHPHLADDKTEPVDWDKAVASLEVDRTVPELTWTTPGTKKGLHNLYEFCLKRLKLFADKRNDPNIDSLSGMSPFFHYGQVSVQRAILEVKKYKQKSQAGYDSFFEEAVVRRELSDNFCFYQKNYDNLDGAYPWARKTLDDHRNDKREFLYSKRQLEEAKTYDELWNSSQIQLVKEGKMHGFMRMYWAKKILEWTKSPEDALHIAMYLNDKYSIDGRDPNGYVGCMWSICGIHDQGWTERPIFGKIRFMNYAGCKRKFDINGYVARFGGKKIKYTGYEE
ncbi:deoxyribodipyrimidine photo-lyase-like isoform X2 [Artemia franciscana]|uniref:deoxyribodipyrimidine photo-lyase-like isoform X2 n=1 Tax=Artemia franciscana TaxID=6661 RepID=UPI0032DB297E